MQNVNIKKSAVALSLGLGLAMGAMTSHTASAATSTYDGWSVATAKDASGVTMRPHLYVSPTGASSPATTVYCFDEKMSEPAERADFHTNPTYTKQVGVGDAFTKAAEMPRLSGDALNEAVTKVIYNGYGNDAAGLQAKYNLTNDEFYSVTQYAVWYYSDGTGAGEDMTDSMTQAYNDLIGTGADALQTPPTNDTLDIYLNVEGSSQNLLSTEMVDKTTDQPATPSAPASSTTPSAPATSTTPSAPASTPSDSTSPSAPATSTTPSAPATTPDQPCTTDTTSTSSNGNDNGTGNGGKDCTTSPSAPATSTTPSAPATMPNQPCDNGGSSNGGGNTCTTPSAPATSTTPSAPATSTTPSAPATPSTPATTPATTPAKPSTPAKPGQPTKPATKRITFRVQYDTTNLHTTAQVNALAKTMNHGQYTYRADVQWNTKTGHVTSAPLWAKGVSTWKIETLSINVPTNATPAQILNAEKAAAATYNHVTLNKATTGKTGHTVHAAYIIPTGAWDNTTTWHQGPHTHAQILAGSTTN